MFNVEETKKCSGNCRCNGRCKNKQKPVCFGSYPNFQEQAENDCVACLFVKECLKINENML